MRVDSRGRKRSRAREALALVTALPLLTYFVYVYRHPVERFAMVGDYAGLELATRYVSRDGHCSVRIHASGSPTRVRSTSTGTCQRA